MKKFTKKSLALFLSVLMAVSAVFLPFSAFGAQLKKAEESKNYVEGEVIVVLKDSAPESYIKPKYAAKNYGRNFSMNKSYTFKKKNGSIRAVVLHSDNKKTSELLSELKNNKEVKYAFPNYKVKVSSITNDTYSNYQWALDNKGQSGGTADFDTQADALWETAASSEKEQVVAVVDTGIDYNHEELKDVLWQNPYGSKLLGKCGYDFTGTIKDRTPYDDNGHGSHVAGIIAAAADNEKGISGINKSNVKIMSCKFLDEDGEGTTEAALAAYEYILRAINLGTNVVAINNSWGGFGDIAEQMLYDEIFNSFGEKGAISLVAAGNESLDLSALSEDEELSFWYGSDIYEVPACSKSEYCLTVAATNEKDELADFSNYSADYVDIAAPGTNILSSVSYNCFNPTVYTNDKRDAVVSSMQDYEGEISQGDFGYPSYFDAVTDSHELYEYLGSNYEINSSDNGFALSSKSIEIQLKDEIDKEEEGDINVYAFAFPYSISDENKPYSISFMFRGTEGVYGFYSDVPADYDFAKNYEDAPLENMIYGDKTGNYWEHKNINIDPSAKEYSKKLKSKNRKLIFVLASLSKDTVVNFDDFAVSAQDIDFAEFEKYDFYNGTSMATPYATGAVALVHNAYPSASTEEVINVIKNTGRISASLEGKTENAKVLALDNCEKTPAMLISAKYNKDGNVEVKGAFKNDISFKINGEDANPISLTDGVAVFADNSYSTKKTEISAQNIYGSDSITTLLSNKPSPKKSEKVFGTPVASPDFGYYMPLGAVSIPAGERSYFVSETGEVSEVSYDGFEDGYYLNDMLPQIDYSVLFKNIRAVRIKSAVYLSNRIYFTALNEISSNYTDVVLGYDNAFGYLDLSTGKTVLLCEFPTETMLGDSLAVYNGAIYLIGGYDIQSNAFSDAVYKYNTSSKSFELTEYTLPEGRAFTNFVQYKDKLFGVYGALENGEMPSIVLFDGTAFTYSAQKLESDDFYEYEFETENKIKIYAGSVGYGTSGVYCNGAYIYGIGDTYYYTMSKDKLSGSKYSFANSIGEKKLIATTLPGAFIAYEIENYASDDEDELGVYSYGLNNSYAAIDETTLKHASISVYYEPNYAFGDKVSLTLTPESGYIIKSISANGVKLSENSNKATVIMNDYYVSITASTQKVAPDKTKGLKVTSSGKNYVITWKKPARAQGYQVQTYKNGKWKTIKTINSGNTLKYKVAKSKVGKKFRVRAFSKYNSKTYYGAWSDTVKVK